MRLTTVLVAALLVATCGNNDARTTDDGGKQKFLWKTGGWGSCYAVGGCGEGRRERLVWCSEADGRTVLEVMCDPQSEPPTSKPCFTACRHHRDKLQWQVGSWGQCLPVSPADVNNVAAVHQPVAGDTRHDNLGVTQRNVSCVLVSHEAIKVHRPVDEENCFTVARKPDPVRFCHIPRPQDCVVGPYGDWSSCKGCSAVNQTRVRAVLVAPLNGGRPCPQLTDTRVCNPRAECLVHSSSSAEEGSRAPSPEYKLKLGEWRRCEAPTSVVSADLIEARVNTPFQQHGGHDALYIPGSSAGSSNNNNNNVFPVSPVLGGTSTESTENYFTFQPQVGYQTREVSCRDSRGAISLCLNEENYRSEMPSDVRPCVVAQDCVVSQWSAWIRTQDGCVAASGKIRPEIYERKREVVRLQEGDGQPCPHILETRHTTDRDQLQLCANKYRWLASKWSPCVVTSDEPTVGPRLLEVGCGGGVQLREVTCVQANQGNQPVVDDLCESLEPLPTVQRCEVACPRDCEVGQWEPWGPCMPLECPLFGDPPAKGYRERRRNIEVMASSQGLTCPSTREVQPCPQPACHSWVEGHWSSCDLDPGIKKCGEGRRTREVTCRSIYGGIVEDSVCARRQVKPVTEEPCLLPCPYDCVLSPWSDWSPCSHSCSSPRQIALRHRNRTVIAPLGEGGHNCPDPDEMLQMEPCNTHSCHGYSWLTLPWQSCHPLRPSERFNITANSVTTLDPELDDYFNNSSVAGNCGAGMQEREVWCMEAHAKRVPDSNCHPLQRPVSSRECWQVCPVDCHVSPWSEWSTCPQQCVPDASSEVREGEVAPTQSRHRVVLRWPSGGGARCPVLEELRPCPLSGARCRHYLWGEGPWSDCQLPATVECGMGYRTRAVWCYKNHRSVKVEPSLCLERNNGTAPSQSEPCFVDCQWPCVLSQWTEWSSCNQACSVRTRTRQLIGLSGSRVPCKDTGLFPLVETQPCPCARYTLQPTGPWSDCLLEGEGVSTSVAANGRVALGVCGAGSRFRRSECLDADGNLVEPSLCGGDSGLEEEPCLIPCPSDCRLGEWSAWGGCSAICGPGLHNRSRQIVHPSFNGGRPCGSLIEHKVCSQSCEVFHWVADGWSECQLIVADRNRGCGTGDQYRRVRCMRIDEGRGISTEVADAYCDPVMQPPDLNACHVACPGSCVLGPWSDWSDCPQPCESSQERQRTRSVLRSPANAHDGATQLNCPPLIEAQACHLNTTCFSYSWHRTELGSCLPLGGSPCGEGVQSRAVFCQRSDGRPVADRYCEATGEGRPSASEKWCYVDCPVDCEVTQWSFWNQSTCHCGLTGGVMVRERRVVTQPSEGGRPCPEPFIQHKSCPALPCYAWHRGSWDSCDLQGAWCGHGIMSRNVTCLRGDTMPVEPHLCQTAAKNSVDLKHQERCYAPCRGDCRVSEWSHWSHCHRNCQAADVGGYETRSRAVLKPPTPGGEPCPTALWETRPCFTGPCLTFGWVVGDDGHISCQRSDGVRVVGGCEGKPKPCTGDDCAGVQHAHCDTQLGVCLCKPGYEPQYDHHQLLLCSVDGQTTSDDNAAQHKVGTSASIIPPVHQTTASEDKVQSRYYYPQDDDISVWMFTMIGIGCIFVVFVAVSIYLMCNGSWSIMGHYCSGQSMPPPPSQQQQVGVDVPEVKP
ncbi:Thrombospondin type-1 domain-containing protein 7B [Zootermopsis nevadensis]|uniref:Thrombospondin type-1 domain-containing protein 7B n=1 Tax=Zootermopsis nevadensis TaxID=136037 RepID=A0A067RMA8_ZOONE|nr:Thrombospondin type-1 domain-containing protein 7B [Zootermopsis nevadensis]